MRTDSAASTIPATAQADKYSVGTSDGVSVRMDMKTQLRQALDTQLLCTSLVPRPLPDYISQPWR